MSQVLTSKYPLFNYTLSGFAPDGVISLASDVELMEFMMRVRIWEIEINVSEATDGAFGGNGTYLLSSRSINTDGVETDVPANERDLVLATLGNHGGLISFTEPISSLYTFSWYVIDRFAVGTTGGVEDTWQIETSFSLGTQPAGKGLDTKNLAANPISSVVCAIYSHTVPLYDTFGGTWTGNITATPIEWWESRPTAGGDPIFDSATGTQINPNVLLG